MGFGDLLWRNNVEPPTFAVGDEVCYWKSPVKDATIVTDVQTATSFDGDDSWQEIKTQKSPYWLPASSFVRVRKVS